MTCLATCIQPSPSNAHCMVCHATFGGITGFDRHRRAGECLDPAALNMHADHRGVWRMDGVAPMALCCEWHDSNDVLCAPDELGGYCCDACPTLAANAEADYQARLAEEAS